MNRFAARPDPPQDEDVGLGEEARLGHRPASRRARKAPAGSAGAGPLPAFPPWARIVASQHSEGRTCQGTDERTRAVIENAEGRTGLSSGTANRHVWDAGEGRGDPEGPGAPAVEAAFLAGAALAALDPLMRQGGASFRGCWLARLALQAAAASAKILGRVEDEAALRDAFCFRPPGADAGPAGSLLAAFRTLAGQRPEWIFRPEAAGKIAAGLGLPALSDAPEGPGQPDPGLTEAVHAAAALAHSDRPAMFAAAEAAALACRSLAPNAGRAGAIFALLLAGAVLACRLGWPMFVPFLNLSKEAGQASLRAVRTPPAPGSERLAAAQTESFGEAWLPTFCLAIAGAAARAHDLYCGLARRAERLEAALPTLRAKGAAGALEKILSGDAVTAAMRPGGLSDRASRRLFDRLVALGVLRELSGRPAFRLYGL